MQIRVLPQLETRDEWLAFFRREQPYCLISAPECLVDLQTHFLQLTLFEAGRAKTRYTLGSRTSIEPAWRLIKGCDWSLQRIINGLEELSFSVNVRDAGRYRTLGDLSVRKSFPRDRYLVAPSATRLLKPLLSTPPSWQISDVQALLANGQYLTLHRFSNSPEAAAVNPQRLLLTLQAQPLSWQVEAEHHLLILCHEGEPLYQLVPDLTPPEPRLKKKQGLVR